MASASGPPEKKMKQMNLMESLTGSKLCLKPVPLALCQFIINIKFIAIIQIYN